MLWRDRRAPLASLILLAAYAGAVVALLGVAGRLVLGWDAILLGDGLRLLLTFNLLLLCWRLGMRGHFTARWYGPGEAMAAIPRAFFSNVVAILAARRAIILYWRMLRSGEVVWDKTDHPRSEPVHEEVLARRVAR